ncbi:MAG: DUF1801 domain-containing protein [Chloroflexi bacterium]|nr:MAG: DUF1801 domain-containing protein [Chloroflexota bacterium]MBL1196594.1 DUF1801 domain-containing protein [Chloroflexota bacterium]NOH13889.1 DUF1801 domain-containing protein [Chloroflexota bacterium]
MSSPKAFEDTLDGKPDFVQTVAKQMRQLVREELANADEGIYGGKAVQNVLYSIGGPNNVICGIQPGKDKVIFYIHNITEADSDAIKLEGKGKTNRHVKLTELDGDTEKELRRLLQLSKTRA